MKSKEIVKILDGEVLSEVIRFLKENTREQFETGLPPETTKGDRS